MTSPTFARLIYPGTGAPFKIVLDNKLVEAVSPPFVYAVKHVDKINYDQETLCNELLRFISGVFNRTDELTSGKEDRKIVKNWIPERTLEFCCTQYS